MIQFISFLLLHYMNRTYFIHLNSADETFGCFQYFGITNNAVMNIFMSWHTQGKFL